ncbi:hypothetical protein [Spirosoma pomorum]
MRDARLASFDMMTESIYKFLADTSNNQPYILSNKTSVLFEVSDSFGILIEFKRPVRDDVDEDDEDEDIELNFEEERELNKLSSDELLSLPSLEETKSIQVYGSEIYGYREVNELDKILPQSNSRTLFILLSKIKSRFPQDGLVDNYIFDINEGFEDWGGYCDVGDYYNFLFRISLKCNNKQLREIIEIINSVYSNPPQISPYIYKHYINLRKIVDTKRVNIINTNTKSRRLGYLKLLSQYLTKYPQTPASQFFKKYESFVIPFQDKLLESSNPKGIIKLSTTKKITGTSAKPYLEIANDLELTNSLNRIVTSSKRFKVYIELSKNYQSKNPFELNFLDKIFFGETLLKYDFLYISVLLELIYVRQETSFSELKRVFQQALIQRLQYFLQDYVALHERRVIDEIRKVRARIEAWEKPDRYLEHVLMPRLNWLLDIDFIKLPTSKNREVLVQITETGERFFEGLCDWYDLSLGWVLDPSDLMSYFFPHIFAKTYRLGINVSLNEIEIKAIVLERINECFKLFQTMTFNRVTLSQTIWYTQYTLLLNHGCSVSSKYINRIIQEDFSNLFIYKFQAQFNDGYLQKLAH